MKLLIVEDRQSVRDLIIKIVTGLSFITAIEQVDDAGKVASAIQAFEPDVMTLDLHLPHGSGLQVLRDMRRAEHAPRVIMITNQADAQTKRACLATGAAFFLDKSKDLESLAVILRQLNQSILFP